MTIDEFIAKYNGKSVRGGQCGELVRQYWIDVDHTIPPSYLNSKDYWFNPVPGYNKVSTPHMGDIAIYNGHGTYPEGHSAIYYDGRVFEQNADPDGSPAHLFTRNNIYLLGYLRKQGIAPEGEPMVNKGDIINMWKSTGITTDPPQSYQNAWNGKGWKSFMYDLTRQPEWLNAGKTPTEAQTKLDQIKKIVG